MRRVQKPEILYEDAAILVCRKPAGLAVESARSGQTDLVSALKNYRAAKGEEPYIGLIHRLDQPVEGVIVFAKTKKAAASLSAQIAEHGATKEYRAVLQGKPGVIPGDAQMTEEQVGVKSGALIADGQEHMLEDFLLRDGKTNTSRVVSPKTAGAKKAVLYYRILETNANTGRSLVAIRLETGRHHQIRVQFASRGCPLYGDQKYGTVAPDQGYLPLALCSCKIGFTHPMTKKEMEFSIDPEPRFRELLSQIGAGAVPDPAGAHSPNAGAGAAKKQKERKRHGFD